MTCLRRPKEGASIDIHIFPSKKREVEHTCEISMPYIAENKSCSDTLPNTRGPKILVLNAPTRENDASSSLKISNSLFDSQERVTDF